MTRFLVAGLLLGGLVWSSAQGAGAPRAADNDTQRIVYLADKGPVQIDLHLRIDGQSFRARHRAFFDSLFDHLDRNRDGVLSRTETVAAPPAEMLASPFGLRGLFRRAGNQRSLSPATGKVTRSVFAAYYRDAGLPAFQISTGPSQLDRPGPFRVNNEITADQMTSRLFGMLDSDKDGKLSRKELEATPAILAKLDIDEDEILTTDEVMGEAGPSARYGLAPAFGRMPAEFTVPVVHVVAEGGADLELAKAIQRRYGLAGHVSEKPDVTLTVRLGNRAGSSLLTIHRDRPLPAGIQVKATSEGATLQLGTNRLDFQANQQAQPRLEFNFRTQLTTLFRRADMDMKGYVEKRDAQRLPFLRDTFDAVDRDTDGKVTEKEMLAYFDWLEALRKKAERSCVSLKLTSEGKGLFDLIDKTADGRLSVRELRNVPGLLAELDENRDGKLARAEVPRRHRAALVLGPSGGQDLLPRVVDVAPRRREPAPRPRAARGPLWFQKLDRNRDGDLSRKEFVGTTEQFREIDTDGDGLISVEESERYDRSKRAGKE